MVENIRDKIENLLSNPNLLLKKAPFTRGSDSFIDSNGDNDILVRSNQKLQVSLPNTELRVISQGQFLKELDPMSHKILYDQNIPTITMKLDDGSYADIDYARMPISFQENIKNKQTLHLSGNPMDFTLMNTNPTDRQNEDFITFKQYWNERNMDGMKTKMVDAQKSVGDAGLLFYFDYNGRIKCRLLKYPDFILLPQNDDNGDRILECVYYSADEKQYLDCYDDTYFYRLVNDQKNKEGWVLERTEKHGFDEIPLITHRGDVAWNNVQNVIEIYEVIYNVFLVIQKRYGRGLLYIKGAFKDTGKRLGGAFILNDTSLDGKGSAEFKTPPSPQNMIETMDLMEQTIQKCSSTTFLLPKDVKSSGDISALAIMLTQSLDIENAKRGVIEWQNVADKMCRLFKQGLAKELVKKQENPTAITDFEKLKINAKFTVWRPQNDYEYNQMLTILAGAGGISKQTLIQKNTISTPDEEARCSREDEKKKQEEQKAVVDSALNAQSTNTDAQVMEQQQASINAQKGGAK